MFLVLVSVLMNHLGIAKPYPILDHTHKSQGSVNFNGAIHISKKFEKTYISAPLQLLTVPQFSPNVSKYPTKIFQKKMRMFCRYMLKKLHSNKVCVVF